VHAWGEANPDEGGAMVDWGGLRGRPDTCVHPDVWALGTPFGIWADRDQLVFDQCEISSLFSKLRLYILSEQNVQVARLCTLPLDCTPDIHGTQAAE
jgi:hypothetical protein